MPPAGWHPDPSGRHELRYWDGRWTEHAASRGQQFVDPLPGTQAPVAATAPTTSDRTPEAPRPDRKVARQARRAGADDVRPGGGTLLTERVLVVNQVAKLVGSTLSYSVHDREGRQLGWFREVRRDMGRVLSDRMRHKDEASREHRFEVVDISGTVALTLLRPEQWFTMKSHILVAGPDGREIGRITQETHGLRAGAAAAMQAGAGLAALSKFGGVAGLIAAAAVEGATERIGMTSSDPARNGHVRFGLEAGTKRLGSIHAMSFDAWDFRVLDVEQTEIAVITKTWAGWAKERFTKADNYVVQVHDEVDDPLRSLLVAAALAVDVALKQGRNTRGSTLLGTRRYS